MAAIQVLYPMEMAGVKRGGLDEKCKLPVPRKTIEKILVRLAA